jgi:ribosomal protein S12 methylthiotransferase
VSGSKKDMGNDSAFHLVSLGCPKARVDSELMAGLMQQEGATLTDNVGEAQTIVVNTCAFLESATQESINTILELARHKREGHCKRLIVTGCLVQRYGKDLPEALPEVDLFLGTNELHRIGEVLREGLPERIYLSEGSHLYEAGDPRFPITQGASTYLKIAEGCNRTCSFCIIPSIRGRQASRLIPDLLREAEMLAGMGIKELVLIAQDLTSYGVDLGIKQGLVKLLEGLNEIEGIHWIRLQYCYPWNFTDELINVLRDCERVVPYVDMPLQHISDRILKSMRRNVKRNAQERLIQRLREIEGMVLRTTLIAGYPGETQAEFESLCDWVREVEFDHMGAFSYSSEVGTLAAELPDQLPEEVKVERLNSLMGLQQQIAFRRNRMRVGQSYDVLVDGPSLEHEFVLEGRYYGQAPEIDGVVFLDFEDGADLVRPGDFVQALISDATEYDLTGRVLSKA